jgi:predicted transcriptional regulator
MPRQAREKSRSGIRDNVVRMLKELNGVTVRQLSRITGISKSVIDRM